MGPLDRTVHLRHRFRLRHDPHLRFCKLVHHRLLLQLRRQCYGCENSVTIGSRGYGSSLRQPHVPQHGLPVGRSPLGLDRLLHRTMPFHLLQVWREC